MSRTLLPQIVRITPSNYADYLRCPRLFYVGTLLGVPASDTGKSPDQGLFVHEVLHEVHTTGSCHDADHVREVLAGRQADNEHMTAFMDRHQRRCPQSSDSQAHEVDRARFHREPKPMFLASARLDAVWIHDGLLDVRDYKTAGKWHDHLVDDPSARVQAWVMGRDAKRRNLRLRLRYEYLSPDVEEDPEPWEPDTDDLAAIEEDLRSCVEHMWEQTDWRGVKEVDVCGRCRYRSICRDSAAPGEPAWPVLALG